MMSLLPPVGWADVATKKDLEALEARLMGQIHREVSSLSKTMVVATIGAVASIGGLAFAAATLV
jgi:hypothetical protein